MPKPSPNPQNLMDAEHVIIHFAVKGARRTFVRLICNSTKLPRIFHDIVTANAYYALHTVP